MKLETKSTVDVSVDDIAKLISDASPDEFAKIMFCVAQNLEKDGLKVENIGKAMSPSMGGLRKHFFQKIHTYMMYYSEVEDKK